MTHNTETVAEILESFTPCGGKICKGCETACKYLSERPPIDGRLPNAVHMAERILELAPWKPLLLGLLARIFRDGGQRASTFPTIVEAVEEADRIVAAMYAEQYEAKQATPER